MASDDNPSALSILKQPMVRRWVLSRLTAGIAVTGLRATVLWQVYDLTRSPALLGLMGLLTFLPAPVAALSGGLAADAYDRRRIVIGAQLIELSCAAALVALNSLASFPLPLLYAVFVLNGVALAFESPSRAAMLSRLVEKDQLARAVTVMSTVQALAFVSGPALAGLLLGYGGARVACLMSLCLLLVSLAMVLRVREVFPSNKRSSVGMTALKEGLSYVLGNRVVLAALSIDLFAVLFGGATAMLPVYAKDVLQVGAKGYGALAACLDAGALLTSLFLIFMPPMRNVGRAIMLSVLAYGAATIAFGLSRDFVLSMNLYFAIGIADQVSVVGRSTLIQLSTPDELRGRVSSVNMVFIIASNQLSIAESGFIAALTSPTFSVVSGGVMVFVVLAAVAVLVPAMWRHTAVASQISAAKA